MKFRFSCQDCGHEFEAEMGGEGSEFEVYRCDECDRILKAEKGDDMPETLMENCGCGGMYWRNRPPRCNRCGGSDLRRGPV